MSSQEASTYVNQITGSEQLSLRDLEKIKIACFSSPESKAEIESASANCDSPKVKGVFAWVMGNKAEAEKYISGDLDTKHYSFPIYLRILLEKRKNAKVIELSKDCSADDANALDVFTAYLEGLIANGDIDQASGMLEKYGNQFGNAADFQYIKGLYLDRVGKYEDALSAYEKTQELEPEHFKSIFRLGFSNDLRGNDAQAIEYYEKCLGLNPTYLNALMNLGLIYDDNKEYEKSVRCFETVLSYFPNHTRAKLHYRDALASTEMFVDEAKEKETSERRAVLDTPITDFELSVRSRNCLAKVGIRSLGELVKKTEPELLAYKNFGETSLAEIKDLLHHHTLRLGMDDEGESIAPANKEWVNRILADGESSVLEKPISMLELSVRSKKCIDQRSIITIGELITHSEMELLGVKNFGQTSMNEIKVKLNDLGLSLKQVEKE